MGLKALGFLGFLGMLGMLGMTSGHEGLYGLFGLYALFALFALPGSMKKIGRPIATWSIEGCLEPWSMRMPGGPQS